jgi:beta-alanine degradation protein BauB
MNGQDPIHTDPDKYRVIFENARVRVLEYRDKPGDRTSPHRHPDSVMYTLSAFRRRLGSGERSVVVEKNAGEVNWLAAQEHVGENVGSSETHVIFVELKGDDVDRSVGESDAPLGPEAP